MTVGTQAFAVLFVLFGLFVAFAYLLSYFDDKEKQKSKNAEDKKNISANL